MQPTPQPGSGKAGRAPGHKGVRPGRPHEEDAWTGCAGPVRARGGKTARTPGHRSGFDAGVRHGCLPGGEHSARDVPKTGVRVRRVAAPAADRSGHVPGHPMHAVLTGLKGLRTGQLGQRRASRSRMIRPRFRGSGTSAPGTEPPNRTRRPSHAWPPASALLPGRVGPGGPAGAAACRGGTPAATVAHAARTILTLGDALLVSPLVCGTRTTRSSPLRSTCAAVRPGRTGHRDRGREGHADVRAGQCPAFAVTPMTRPSLSGQTGDLRPERAAHVPGGRVCTGCDAVERGAGWGR
jgi:hypothetical protein